MSGSDTVSYRTPSSSSSSEAADWSNEGNIVPHRTPSPAPSSEAGDEGYTAPYRTFFSSSSDDWSDEEDFPFLKAAILDLQSLNADIPVRIIRRSHGLHAK